MGTDSTFGSSDVINGGAGADTLSVVGAASASIVGVTTGVETISINQSTAHNASFAINAVAATGIETVKSYASTGDVSVTNLANTVNLVADGTVGTLASDIAAVSATVINSVVSGTADAITMTAQGGATAEFNATGVTTTLGYETINLVSAGADANSVQIGSTTAGLASTLNISGAAALTLAETAIADAGEIDASAMTGVLTTTLDANVDAFTGGAGADVITVPVAELTSSTVARSINLGNGADTLVVDGDVTSLAAASSGLHSLAAETIKSTEGNASGSAHVAANIKASLVTGVETVKFSGTNANSGSYDLNAAVTDTTNALTVDMATTDTSASGVVNLALTAVADSEGNTANVKLSTAALGTITLNESSSADDVDYYTTLNLNVNKAASTLTTLVGLSLNTVNITGTGNLTFTGTSMDLIDTTNAAGVAAADRAITINSTGLTGSVDLTLTEAGAFTVNVGAGVADATSGVTNTVALGTVGASKTVVGSTGALDVVTLTEGNSATALAATITNVDRVAITESSGTQVISLANFSNVGEVTVSGGESITLSNVGAGQVIKTGVRGSSDALSIQTATGVTSAAVTLTGATAMDSGSGITTNATTFTVTDAAADATGNKPIDNNITFVDTHAVTTLNVVGGGVKHGGTALSTVTIADGTDTGILRALDFTGYAGHVVMSSLELGNSTNPTTVAMASAAAANLTVSAAMLYRDQLSITGGTGANAVVATGVGASGTSALRPAMSGVETLDLTLVNTSDIDSSVELRDATSVTTVKLAVAETSSASDAQAYASDIEIANLANNGTIQLNATSTGATTYGYDGAGTAANAEGILVSSAITGATVLNVNNTGAAADVVVAGAVAYGGLALGATYTTLNIDGVVASKALTFARVAGSGLTTVNLENNTTASSGTLTVTELEATALTTLNIDSTKGAVTVSDLNTMNSLETLTVNTGVAAGGGTATITAGTSTSIDTITASGTGAFTITALSASSLDSINASGVTGVVTLGNTTTAALTTAAGASITTGTANDIVSVNSSTLGAVTLGSVTNSDGVLTDNDTLYLIGAQGSGTGVIDLSQTGDQILTINGQSNTTVQTGIDSVNVASMTSTNSYGWTLTARSAGSTITGSGYNDVINGGAAADVLNGGAGNDTITTNGGGDTVTGGAGTDTITLGAGVDTVVFGTAIAGTASVTTATTAITTDSGDTISGFTTTADKLQFKAAVLNSIDGVTTTAGSAFAAAQALTTAQLKVYGTGANLTAVASGDGARFILDKANGNLYLDVTGDSTSSASTITDANGDDILIATLTGVTTLAVGDFVIVA